MRKFLVIGCGGSGGTTLRLMMDQLQADLRTMGISSLPDAWQFVHVDVPVPPDTGPAPIGTIRDLGGTYLSFSAPGNSYQNTAQNLEAMLGGRADSNFAPLLGWAPKDSAAANIIPVTHGAGQYRSVGRMLTLPRLRKLVSTLEDAQARMSAPDAWGDVPIHMRRDHGAVIPIIIGSMAGGSGASMFLDVARVVGALPGINTAEIGAILYTADVFAKLDEPFKVNVEANSMAAFSETIAAISGISDPVDRAAQEAVGLNPTPAGKPAFGRVIPVGSKIGANGAIFGYGEQEGVYRGMARALAGLMISEQASEQYVHFMLGNPAPVTTTTDRFGWGIDALRLPLGSMGYASLSLGRDRYLHYAAQRLARATVDHLLEGHKAVGNGAADMDQLNNLVDNQLEISLRAMGLPEPGQAVPTWFSSVAYPKSRWQPEAREALGPAELAVRSSGTAKATQWLSTAQSLLGQTRMQVNEGLQARAYAWAEQWAESLEQTALDEFVRNASVHGLPFAREVCARIRREAEAWVTAMTQAGAQAGNVDPVGVQPSATRRATALAKAVVGADDSLGQDVLRSIRDQAETRLRLEAAQRGVGVLQAFASDVLAALETAANTTIAELVDARSSKGERQVGLAQLATDKYSDWPDETSSVPSRFDHALNEVLLTTSAAFSQQFANDVTQLGEGTYTQGLRHLVGSIIRGTWETPGAKVEQQVLKQHGHWRPQSLPRAGLHGEPTAPARPQYGLLIGPRSLLKRAHLRLAVPGEAFQRFAGETIGEYLRSTSITDLERATRRDQFATKFLETMELARPLVGIDSTMVLRLHQVNTVEYLYSFSEIPFDQGDPVAQLVMSRLNSPELGATVKTNFQKALAGGEFNVGKISIFGSYPKYSPLCFTSLIGPVAARFHSATKEAQSELWKWKSARPLLGSLAMSPREADAIIAGWYIGRLLGLVRQPTLDSGEDLGGVEVATADGWIGLRQILKSSDRFVRNDYDILPAVLMSHAWNVVRCDRDPELEALAPYEALRRLCDTSPSTAGLPDTTGLSGTQLLAQAYAGQPLAIAGRTLVCDGLSPVLTGLPTPSSSLSQGLDQKAAITAQIEQRHNAILEWSAQFKGILLSLDFVTRGERGGEWKSQISSTKSLHNASLFAELAPAVMSALERIEVMANAARDVALRQVVEPDGRPIPYV